MNEANTFFYFLFLISYLKKLICVPPCPSPLTQNSVYAIIIIHYKYKDFTALSANKKSPSYAGVRNGDTMKKILVLEDDETIRMGLCYILKTKGYEPVPAENIAAARELFHGCSLCLLDVMLPDGSGVDLCKEIRQCSNVPVIFLTCVDDSTRISRALDIGGDDYVIKPFDSAVLLSRINAALRRSGQTENSILDELELTAIERELLGYFRLNRGRVLTREQILSRLWDSRGEFVGDNTLSVRINRLRAKLEKAGTDGRIVTVKGVGYKWEV